MFIQTPFFCKKFVTLRTVLGPHWIRLKCSFWLFFYLKYFQHEVQFVTFLQNSNVWDAAVRVLFLVINEKLKCKVWQTKTPTRALLMLSQIILLCYFLIFWEGREVVRCEEWYFVIRYIKKQFFILIVIFFIEINSTMSARSCHNIRGWRWWLSSPLSFSSRLIIVLRS